jgi:serine protease
MASGAGLLLGGIAAQVAPASAAPAPSGRATNPYSPAYAHAYRHGVVPTVGQNAKMRNYAAAHPSAITATGPETLAFGGGIDGIGVTSSTPKIYLVFWGNQWGTQGSDGSGNLTFSHDGSGGAPYIQNLFKGLGTGGELWSGTMTQYCDGPTVGTGATSCPSGAPHVGYPTGGPYAGVWYDNAAAEPAAASGRQIGTVAVQAAAHFGNTSAASNRYVQYDILSAPGLNPDNYQTQGFCAWHDYNGDSTLSGGAVTSPYGDIAFTNMPYVMDAGASCGQGFVNSPGTLDGYSIVNGHEYAETVTDQNPAGGWTNQQSNSFGGQENGDECAWITSGQGASANVATGAGTFAMQSTWSNDTNRCDISHQVVGGGGGGSNSVTVTNPGSRTGTVGTATSLQITAKDSASGQTLTYKATGLPTGLSIKTTSGLISGTPSAAGSYSVTVTATDATGAHGSASFAWTISGSGTGCASPGQKFVNPGFESGSTGWSATSGVINTDGAYAHTGAGYAWLDGYGVPWTDTLSQSVNIPAGCHATLSYYLWISSNEPTAPVDDTLTVTANGTTVQSWSQANQGGGYVLRSVSVSAFAGKAVTFKWTGAEHARLGGTTSFFIDDTSLTLS